MSLTGEGRARITAAFGELLIKAHEATSAPDTETAKRALDALWHATHQAREALTSAEREARQAALKHVEGSAA